MKKVFFVGLFLIGVIAVKVYANNSDNGSTNFDADTTQVSLSTTPASPTQLLIRDSYIQRTWIMHSSTCSVFISTSSAGMSFTTSAFIPGNGASTNLPVLWTPDGPTSPYWGALWGVSNCAAKPTISVFRSK